MQQAQRAVRYFIFSVWAVIMTALTYVLGAVSLKMLRRRFGRAGYWGLCTGLSAAMFAAQMHLLAVAFFSLVLLVGIFSELEEMGLSFNISAFFTLVINSLLSAGAFAIWAHFTGGKWSQQVVLHLEKTFKPLVEINPHLQINYHELMLILPSVILIMWLGALYLAIILESRFEPAEPSETGMRAQVAQFRVPDVVMWAFIVALLGTFGGLGHKAIEAVSANVLNLSLMLFFLQGIAVVAKFFESLRVTSFWQTLFMILIVVYLFLFVSVIGLTDYWFDFRSRMSKRTEEFNRET